MPTTASVSGIARTILSMLPYGGADILNNIRLRLNHFLDRARNMILGMFDVSQRVAQVASSTATLEDVCTQSVIYLNTLGPAVIHILPSQSVSSPSLTTANEI